MRSHPLEAVLFDSVVGRRRQRRCGPSSVTAASRFKSATFPRSNILPYVCQSDNRLCPASAGRPSSKQSSRAKWPNTVLRSGSHELLYPPPLGPRCQESDRAHAARPVGALISGTAPPWWAQRA